MDKVVHQIAEAEDTNYTLFNFVNELDKDIEKLEARINEVKEDLNQQCGTSLSDSSTDRRSTPSLQESSEAPADLPEMTKKETEISEEEKTTEIIFQGVKDLLKLLPEAYDAQTKAAGDEITADNLEQYLGVVESFIDDLVHVTLAVLACFVHPTLCNRRTFNASREMEISTRHQNTDTCHFQLGFQSRHHPRNQTNSMASTPSTLTMRSRRSEKL